MRRFHQFVLAIAVLLALPAPTAIACFIGASHGATAAHECCVKMETICGTASKSDSMGCCVRHVVSRQAEAISPKPFSLADAATHTGISIPIATGLSLRRASQFADWAQAHPPGPDLSALTPLRI
jgi:hypothetical protein